MNGERGPARRQTRQRNARLKRRPPRSGPRLPREVLVADVRRIAENHVIDGLRVDEEEVVHPDMRLTTGGDDPPPPHAGAVLMYLDAMYGGPGPTPQPLQPLNGGDEELRVTRRGLENQVARVTNGPLRHETRDLRRREERAPRLSPMKRIPFRHRRPDRSLRRHSRLHPAHPLSHGFMLACWHAPPTLLPLPPLTWTSRLSQALTRRENPAAAGPCPPGVRPSWPGPRRRHRRRSRPRRRRAARRSWRRSRPAPGCDRAGR